MKVVITTALVREAVTGANVLKLHDLVGYAKQRNRHFLHFESDECLDLVVSTYAKPIQHLYRNLLEQSVRSAITFPSGRVTVKVDLVENSNWQMQIPIITLDDSLRLLAEKLAILLENAANDWHFLLGVMSPMDRKLLLEYVSAGWVEPMHGGGDTLGQLLSNRVSVPWTRLRTFVIFDSDRLHPDEFHEEWTTARPGRKPSSCHAYEWEKTAKQHIPDRYWMLKRRYIESYLPKEELRLGKENKASNEAVDIFFGMSQTQRWYFNMKDGFDKDAARDDSERNKELYVDINPDQRARLKQGFGRTLARHFSQSVERDFAWDPEARAEADSSLPKLMQLL